MMNQETNVIQLPNPMNLSKTELQQAEDLIATAFPEAESGTADVVDVPTSITEVEPKEVLERVLAKDKIRKEITEYANMSRDGGVAVIMPETERNMLIDFLNDKIDEDPILAVNINRENKSIRKGLAWSAKHIPEKIKEGMAVVNDAFVFELMLEYFAFDEEKAAAEEKAKRDADEAKRKAEKAKKDAEKRKEKKEADKKARLAQAQAICDSVTATAPAADSSGKQMDLFSLMDQGSDEEEKIAGVNDEPLTATDKAEEEAGSASDVAVSTISNEDLDSFPFGFDDDIKEEEKAPEPKPEKVEDDALPFTADFGEESSDEESLPWNW